MDPKERRGIRKKRHDQHISGLTVNQGCLGGLKNPALKRNFNWGRVVERLGGTGAAMAPFTKKKKKDGRVRRQGLGFQTGGEQRSYVVVGKGKKRQKENFWPAKQN